jgi:predicted alpha/beta superfamily hydrolase/TolA-binding protein
MMKHRQTPLLFAALAALLFFSGRTLSFAQKDGDDIVIGKYRVIHSQILDEDRLLFVHLPRDYGETRLAYPVLYLLYVDVFNYFADAAMVTERLGTTGEIPSLIIVGVANSNRYRDLLPIKTRDRSEGGGSDNFLRFLEDELIPHVEKTYRTKSFRILAGPQAAAVFSLYTLITRPGLFQAVISENPFMNPENAEFLYPKAESFFKNTAALKDFLYIKCEKDERPQDLAYAQKLAQFLEAKKPDGFRFYLEMREPSGDFIAAMPFRNALKALFPGHKLPANFQTNSLRDIIDYYQQRSEKYGFEVDPPSLLLTFEGDKLNRKGKRGEAIEVFDYQLAQNPKSLNALWQLGETYREMGEFEKARDYYKKFLEIRDTDVAMIQTRLKQMEKILGGSAAYRVEQEIRRNGLQAGLKTFRAIRSDPNSGLYFEEDEFNALGYRLMGAGSIEDAIEIFKRNADMYPDSANAYDSLAEAYMNSGNTGKAIKNYRKSLELNPGNTNAKEMLKKLGQK